MFFQDRAKEIADASNKNRITKQWQACYDLAMKHLGDVCDKSANETRMKTLKELSVQPVRMGDFLAVMEVIKIITEEEFRLAGLYEAAPDGLHSEERREREWKLFHTHPLIWLLRTGYVRAYRLWDIINAKLRKGPEEMEKT